MRIERSQEDKGEEKGRRELASLRTSVNDGIYVLPWVWGLGMGFGHVYPLGLATRSILRSAQFTNEENADTTPLSDCLHVGVDAILSLLDRLSPHFNTCGGERQGNR